MQLLKPGHLPRVIFLYPSEVRLWDGHCSACRRQMNDHDERDVWDGGYVCMDCSSKLLAADAAIAELPAAGGEYLASMSRWDLTEQSARHTWQAAKDEPDLYNEFMEMHEDAKSKHAQVRRILVRRSDSMVRQVRRHGIDPTPLLRFLHEFQREHFKESLFVVQQTVIAASAPVVLTDDDYKTAGWFKQETGIDPARLRAAKKGKRLPTRGEKKQTRYHVPTAKTLWPQDFPDLLIRNGA